MRMGLRVYEVVLKPRYMPVSGIMVFGLAGVFIFLVNSNYFPFYQALAGRYVFWGDNARREGKTLQAEEMYRQALAMESRNQRANISLASLYMETGNFDKAFVAAQTSLEKNPVPEAVMIMAGIYRAKNNTLEEILALQNGLRKFPGNGRLMNNAGIAFSSTLFQDSALFYLQKAEQSAEAKTQARANLGFLKLWKGTSAAGPENAQQQKNPGDWASLNNQMVFSAMARKPAEGLAALPGIFPEIPEEIRPYILYHALLNKAINRDTSGLKELVALQDDSIRKYYSEGTELGLALARYRGREVFSGLNRLIGLHEASGNNRRDLGLLLGQVYFEQGSYGSAAAYFRNAAKNGMQQAWYWYAVAVLDLGLGEEAAAAFRESLPFLGPQEKMQVQALISSLESSESDSVAVQSDADKSAFIKTKWNQLEDRQVKDLIFVSSDPAAKRLLWKYSFRRAYHENKVKRCADLFRFGEDFFGKDKAWEAELKEARPMFYEITGNKEALKKSAEKAPAFFRGLKDDWSGQSESAIQNYRLTIQESPLMTRQVVLSVQRMADLGRIDEAYKLSLDVQRIDPSNPEYLRLYALMALRMGLADFAFQCLPKYRELASAAQADSLKAKMETELKSRNLPVPVTDNP
jgi:tetratricopeptide (TPR) repeat protein